MMKNITIFFLFLGLSLVPVANAGSCGACGTVATAAKYGAGDKVKAKAGGDVVAVAAGNASFSTLVAAVKAAGLVETLQGAGPFTIFAPTNEAFAALPAGTVESLLKPENRDQLIAILTYHVVPANVPASAVKAGKAPTVNGSDLRIVIREGKVMVNDATVIQTDVEASNGVIHIIDKVMIPPARKAVAMR
jgi:uncharacterized surface protein with fasciclin (FAS1) repeats